MASAFIHDGYTEYHTLSAEESLCVPCSATVRPKTAHELSRLADETEKLSNEKQRIKIAELIAPHILSWDVGETDLKPTAENILKLRQQVFHWLFQCVCGNRKALLNDAKN